MRALDKKLYRDVFRLKGQVVTIALVVACGIASYVALGAAFRSLSYSRDSYYERYRFGDAFCRLKRAPESLAGSLAEIPGVARIYPRLVENVMLPLPDMAEPAFGEVVSLPRSGQPPLDGIHLREGRFVEPGRADEVVLLEAFAEEHRLEPGDTLPAVINGRLRRLRIVGLAMSPEYVFGAAPGDVFGDSKRFAVLWMDRDGVAPAFQMAGAFDSVVLSLQPGASRPAVLAAVDRLLRPYGGTGAYGRHGQTSNKMLETELQGLRTMATSVPLIFLAVAAFLLNVVLARLVQLQRPEIAALKALGYRDLEIGLHYLKLVSVVVVLGALIGLLLGAWLGSGMMVLYHPFFRFPSLTLRLDPDLMVNSLVTSLAAALVGGLGTVRSIARLPPAEAMRPPAPVSYRVSILERLGLGALVGVAGRMVLRELWRRPVRLLISTLGIAFAVAILVAGRANIDAIDYFMEVQFHGAQLQDATASFVRPTPARSLRALAHTPGVLAVEGTRQVPVRYRNGPIFRDSVLIGHEPVERLTHILDRRGRPLALPAHGLILEKTLAEILRARVGDVIEVEEMEGEHRRRPLPIEGLVDSTLGLAGHIRAAELARFLGQDELYSSAAIAIDPLYANGVYRALKGIPQVVGVTRKASAIEQFQSQSGGSIITMTIILTLFAATIAIGVVYNNARIALSQRARELASLRVLGFTRAEVSTVLLSEMGVQVILAMPPGLWLGYRMAVALASMADPETYRFPVVISGHTYVFAVLVVVASALVSGLIVRRRVDRLDLVSVLKSRE